jgi:purine-nucleoside phosphorylase
MATAHHDQFSVDIARMSQAKQQVEDGASYVMAHTSVRPSVALVLGSGLTHVSDAITEQHVIPYCDVPGFPRTTVPGHAGKLILGQLGSHAVAVLSGRPHYYEGYSATQVAFPVRMLAAIGCRTLVLTNAAGGLNPEFRPGDLMLITDHVNFLGFGGANPLAGPDGAEFGTQFVEVKYAYDRALGDLAAESARRLGFVLRQGIYVMVPGPNYETIAEINLMRLLGADAVGMSTVTEVLAGRQLGMRVLAVSCITNMPVTGARASHEEVIEQGTAAGARLASLIREVVSQL